MAIFQGKPTTKASGGRYKKSRDKILSEMGNSPTLPRIGKQKKKMVRTKGGQYKTRVLLAESINLFDPKTKKYVKATAKLVVQNPANRHYVRKNILRKGAIVETDKGKARIMNRPGQEGSVNAILIG